MWQDAGFLTGKPDIKLAMKQLAHFIEAFRVKFNEFTIEDLLKKPAPDK